MEIMLSNLSKLFRGIISKKCTFEWKNAYFTSSKEISHPLPRKAPAMSADEAIKCVKSGNLVFISGAASTPDILCDALAKHCKEQCLKNVRTCHMHLEGKVLFSRPEYKDHVRPVSYFIDPRVRIAVADGRADPIPIFLQDIPATFYKKIYEPDVALIQVSPPDRHGFCTLGTSVDCVRAGCLHSKKIIAQVNSKMPRTFGDSIIHSSHFDAAVELDTPLPAYDIPPPTPEETKIGQFIAGELILDGSTLQMGIGTIPNAVLSFLTNHKDLAIHSEMFADGIIPLVINGNITNAKKPIHRGRIVGSFLIGSNALYEFIDDNPFIEMLRVDYVNNLSIITQMPRMTAINSAIEVDLTGQVCADSIGPRLYSGFGGQVDFIRGSAEGKDGKGVPIITLESVTSKGESKIVPLLKHGAGVVTTRAHVHYIVTEYGIASLFGRPIRHRAHQLIGIAHPDHREKLEKAFFERFKCMPSKD